MINIFKNCSVIYFKKGDDFVDFVNAYNSFFKGKILISECPELGRICYIYGIMHILNLSHNYIPNEKIDCIITTIKNDKNDTDLETKIVRSGLNFPIVYMDLSNKKIEYKQWCGICNTINPVNKVVGKYCSEKCMSKDSGFSSLQAADVLKDLSTNNIVSKLLQAEKEKELVIEFNKSLSNKKTTSNVKKNAEKFQTSVVKDAIRLEYAIKRESYKKEMRQPSLRKTTLSNKKIPVVHEEKAENIQLCKSVTKKGHRCTNKALKNSDFCGILSHSTGKE